MKTTPPTDAPLAFYVVYLRPTDYPHSLILRRQILRRHEQTKLSEIVPDPCPLVVMLADYPGALDTIRAELPPGLVRVQGPGDDPDPCILEVWV
jgi:hypothetical protein